MNPILRSALALTLTLLTTLGCTAPPAITLSQPQPSPQDTTQRLRFATMNLLDLRLSSFEDPEALPRIDRLVDVARTIDADVLLLNEVHYDRDPNLPGGLNASTPATLFADRIASASASDPQGQIRYIAYAWPSNTGLPSGADLDRSGDITTTPGSRAYGGDCRGYGEFPGHYAMALLVRQGLEVDTAAVRTFQNLLWRDMPSRLTPLLPTGDPWYDDNALANLPLSSKSHWIIPIRFPNLPTTPAHPTINIIASHPTPPVFDGPEDRNGKRNHDEIRLLKDLIENAQWPTDDSGTQGGLPKSALFVILGDLNADPNDTQRDHNPIATLLSSPRLAPDPTPTSTLAPTPADARLTSDFGKRVDYALPSTGLTILDTGVYRGGGDRRPHWRLAQYALTDDFPSDHFPVWIDLAPAPSSP